MREGLKMDPIHQTVYPIFSLLLPNLISLWGRALHKGFALLLALSGLSEGSHVVEPFVQRNDSDHFYYGPQIGQIPGDVMQIVSLAYMPGG